MALYCNINVDVEGKITIKSGTDISGHVSCNKGGERSSSKKTHLSRYLAMLQSVQQTVNRLT